MLNSLYFCLLTRPKIRSDKRILSFIAKFFLLLFSLIFMHTKGITKNSFWQYYWQDLLLAEVFIIAPNADNLYLPNQRHLKHIFLGIWN